MAAIRLAVPSDYADLVRMACLLHPDADPGELAHEARSWVDAPRADYGILVWVRPAGGLGGYVEVGTRPYAEGCASSPVGYVEGWFVDADLRRGGVGRRLLAAAEAWALARGLTELASDALLDNAVSHAAHRACGFAEVERIVCFRKDLGAATHHP